MSKMKQQTSNLSHLILAIEQRYLDANIESFFFFDETPKAKSYMRIENGVAIVEIFGATGRRTDGWSGIVDTETLINDITAAALEDDIKKIVLHIDSPGGTVDGTKELVEAVKEATQFKKVVAFSDGLLASAAMWVASAATEIYTTPTAQIGSIGVVATHIDLSERYKEMGVKKTYIYNGKYKRIANETEPLSTEGKDYLQKMVDDIYAMFAEDVATNRGLDIKDIYKMESAIFLSKDAEKNGLIDGIKTNFQREVLLKMDKKQLKAEFPQVYDEILQEGVASVNQKQIVDESINAERSRIIDIKESSFSGQESLVEELIESGATANAARIKLIDAQKQSMKDGLTQIAASDPGDLGANDEPETIATDNKTTAGDKLDAITQGVMIEKNCDYETAFKEACSKNPILTKIYNGK